MKKISSFQFIFFSLFLLFALDLSAQDAKEISQNEWKRILTEIDRMTNFDNTDFTAEISVVTSRPDKDDEEIQARYFRRDKDNQFVILILNPKDQRGQGYLAIGDKLWIYDPNSRKTAPGSFKNRFGDSEANNSDFSSSSLAKDYDVVSGSIAKLGKFEVYNAVLKAKRPDVSVDTRKLWIRTDNLLVLKEEQWSASGLHMRTVYIPEYQKVDGRFFPVVMKTEDKVKKGEKSLIQFKNASIKTLPDSTFSKGFLERVND